jgi:hypothetical protein
MLAGDSRAFVEELRAAGAAPDVRIDRGAFHVIALLPGTMKRSRQAIRAMADFILVTTARGELSAGPRAGAG